MLKFPDFSKFHEIPWHFPDFFLVVQNSLAFPNIALNSLTFSEFHKIPWLFPNFTKFPDFSLTFFKCHEIPWLFQVSRNSRSAGHPDTVWNLHVLCVFHVLKSIFAKVREQTKNRQTCSNTNTFHLLQIKILLQLNNPFNSITRRNNLKICHLFHQSQVTWKFRYVVNQQTKLR